MTNTRYPPNALLKIKIIYIELLKGLIIPHRMYDLFKKAFVEIKIIKGLIYHYYYMFLN